jgi:GAF domain-containing protein
MDSQFDQLTSIQAKLQQIGALLEQLRAENDDLRKRNDELELAQESQKQLTNDQIAFTDPEVFASRLMLAKKIKREVEQTLRDAERKLEALRF